MCRRRGRTESTSFVGVGSTEKEVLWKNSEGLGFSREGYRRASSGMKGKYCEIVRFLPNHTEGAPVPQTDNVSWTVYRPYVIYTQHVYSRYFIFLLFVYPHLTLFRF